MPPSCRVKYMSDSTLPISRFTEEIPLRIAKCERKWQQCGEKEKSALGVALKDTSER